MHGPVLLCNRHIITRYLLLRSTTIIIDYNDGIYTDGTLIFNLECVHFNLKCLS